MGYSFRRFLKDYVLDFQKIATYMEMDLQNEPHRVASASIRISGTIPASSRSKDSRLILSEALDENNETLSIFVFDDDNDREALEKKGMPRRVLVVIETFCDLLRIAVEAYTGCK